MSALDTALQMVPKVLHASYTTMNANSPGVIRSRRFEWIHYVVRAADILEETWIAVIVCGPPGRSVSRPGSDRPDVNRAGRQRLAEGVRRRRNALTIAGCLAGDPESVGIGNADTYYQVIRNAGFVRGCPCKCRLQRPNCCQRHSHPPLRSIPGRNGGVPGEIMGGASVE